MIFKMFYVKLFVIHFCMFKNNLVLLINFWIEYNFLEIIATLYCTIKPILHLTLWYISDSPVCPFSHSHYYIFKIPLFFKTPFRLNWISIETPARHVESSRLRVDSYTIFLLLFTKNISLVHFFVNFLTMGCYRTSTHCYLILEDYFLKARVAGQPAQVEVCEGLRERL